MADTIPDLSIVIPAMNEADNLAALLPELFRVVGDLGCAYEIIVVVGQSSDDSAAVARRLGAMVIEQRSRGYGGALQEGFAASRSTFIITMDADLSHPATFVTSLWNARHDADLLLASRFMAGGGAKMPVIRYVLSRILNIAFGYALSLDLTDISTGFRLYRRVVLEGIDVTGSDFDVQQQTLMHIYAAGFRVREIPFVYQPRGAGHSKARMWAFGRAYARTLWRTWRQRTSVSCADYDHRAYYSHMPFQRIWQRTRYRIVTEMAGSNHGLEVLDVGCGSSMIPIDLDAVSVDIQHNKLRYLRQFGNRVARASAFNLPFHTGAFGCVICSEVLEHVPDDSRMIEELIRVLAPGGTLVLGTPDYSRRAWRLLERLYGIVAPGGYADEHITRYTFASLTALLTRYGFRIAKVEYVFGADMFVAFECAPCPATAPALDGSAGRAAD
ncbi:MAG: bifunctional glycosyltransferase/class I SAM-dependent methyltransferase [Chloroflexota bacterium]|nr:bifunctional glycosyltransferase/class I SAM-dependent methyltransferase [Chloroflexota bacterium]